MAAGGSEQSIVQERCCQLSRETAEQTIETALVMHGGFLDHLDDLPVALVGDDRPRIPVNPNTGLTYPLIMPEKASTDTWTRHHHNFPDKFIGGRAIRHVYVQQTFPRLHNDGPMSLHEQCSLPEELPRTAMEEFGIFAMGLARDIPHEGLDVFSGDPLLRTMTGPEEERVMRPSIWGLVPFPNVQKVPAKHLNWRSVSTWTASEGTMYNPTYDYATKLLLAVVPYIDNYERQRRIFANTTHPEVGYEMLRQASHLIIEAVYFRGGSLINKYNDSWQSGRLREDAPEDCRDLLLAALGSRNSLADVFLRLKEVTREEITPIHINEQLEVA